MICQPLGGTVALQETSRLARKKSIGFSLPSCRARYECDCDVRGSSSRLQPVSVALGTGRHEYPLWKVGRVPVGSERVGGHLHLALLQEDFRFAVRGQLTFNRQIPEESFKFQNENGRRGAFTFLSIPTARQLNFPRPRTSPSSPNMDQNFV